MAGLRMSNVVIPLVNPSPPTAIEIVAPGRIATGIDVSEKSALFETPIHFGLRRTGAPDPLTIRLPYTFPLSTFNGGEPQNCVGNDVTFACRHTPSKLRGSTGPSSGSA